MIYALIVGINSYKSRDILNLSGCENDAKSVELFLSEKFGENAQIKTFLSSQATRKSIIQGFREHLAQAKKGDIAFFFYAGHGCREPSPKAFIPWQKDDHHENIVCYDSLVESEDLADREINLLIRELSQNGAEPVLMFDCCHSASATRMKKQAMDTYRMDTTRAGVRSKDKFLPGVFEQLGTESPSHIYLAACQQDQLSSERAFGANGEVGGVFTKITLEVLRNASGTGLITYANLETGTRYFMERLLKGPFQVPQLEVFGDADPNKFFLQNEDDHRQANVYQVRSDNEGKWKIPLGILHGLKTDELATFLLYRDAERKEFIGKGEIESCKLYESELSLPPDFFPRQKSFFYAVPLALPLEKLAVYIREEEGDIIRKEVDKLWDLRESEADHGGEGPSKQELDYSIFWTHERELARYGLVAKGNQYQLIYTETHTEVASPAEPLNLNSSFPLLAKGLVQLAAFERLRSLENRNKTEFIQPQSFKIRFQDIDKDKPYERDELTLDYRGKKINFKVEGENKYNAKLHIGTYYFSRHFQIFQLDYKEIPQQGGFKILDQGNFSIPEEPGLYQISEDYTFILTSEPLPYLNLNAPQKLSEVLAGQAASHRDRGFNVVAHNNWTTKHLKIKLLKEVGSIGKEDLRLESESLFIRRHPTFSASLGLSSSASHLRGPASDRFLYEHCSDKDIELINFSSKGSQVCLLELHHLRNEEALESEALEISLLKQLPDHINLYAITLPGDLWEVPLRIPILAKGVKKSASQYQFHIEHLPPNPDDGRLLPGTSCKIAFAMLPQGKEESLIHHDETFFYVKR